MSTETTRQHPVQTLRRVAGSVALTSRGIGFLVAAAVTLVLAPLLSLPALLYVTGLLVGLVVFSGLFVFVGHSRVRIERAFAPQVVSPGATSHASVRMTNLSVLPCMEARWEDTLPRGLSGNSSGVLPALGGSHAADARVSFGYAVHGQRRGQHAVGPLRVHILDPFGLVFRRHAFGRAEPLIVLPRRVELPALTPRGASDEGATRPAPQYVGVGDDDVIARTYLPGDAMKRLHWKATAHRGQLMVRQEEQKINPRAGVFIDCEPRSVGTARDPKGEWEHSAAFEWGVVAAASIVHHLTKAGYVVTLQSSSSAIDRHIADGHDTVPDAMTDLAVIEPGDDHHHLLPAERAAFAVLGRLDENRARHWIDSVGAARSVCAFVAAGTSLGALDVLAGARWRVVTYRPQDDVAERWAMFDGVGADAAT